MRIRAFILAASKLLLWLSLAVGLGIAAFDAARYSALTFYYYYGQHCLLEPIVEQPPNSVTPAHEGRLVRVSGPVAESTLRDPLYHVQAQGVRMERHIIGIPCSLEEVATLDAPPHPPEPHLAIWRSTHSARIGCYELLGAGLEQIPLRYSERPILSVMGLPPALREQAEIEAKSIVLPSINGFRYRVKFIVYKGKDSAFLGRQKGSALLSDAETIWRTDFMANHLPQPLYKAGMNAVFFLFLAWAATILTLYALNKAMRCTMAFAELAWHGLLLSCVAGLSVYSLLVEKGVLWSNPTWDLPKARTVRLFVPGRFMPSSVESVQLVLWVGIGLCIALALALGIWRSVQRKNSAKKA